MMVNGNVEKTICTFDDFSESNSKGERLLARIFGAGDRKIKLHSFVYSSIAAWNSLYERQVCTGSERQVYAGSLMQGISQNINITTCF